MSATGAACRSRLCPRTSPRRPPAPGCAWRAAGTRSALAWRWTEPRPAAVQFVGRIDAMLQTAVLFDMRAPAIGAAAPELYAAALDMAAFADEIGIDFIGLMEHHGSDDGYLP